MPLPFKVTNKHIAPCILFLILSSMACLKYASLHTSVCDLGIFFSILHNIQKGQWSLLFSGHAWPLLLPYAWFFALPGEQTGALAILIVQAFLLALPACGLIKRYGWPAFWTYAIFFPLWYNALFDFHIDHLAVPILFWFFFWAEDQKYWQCLLPGCLLMLVKEIFALQASACGVFLFLANRSRPAPAQQKKQHPVAPGIMLSVLSSVYFYFVTTQCLPFFSPHGSPEGIHSVAFSWMGQDLRQISLYIITHPLMILQEMFSNTKKTSYVILLLASLGFLPLLKPKYLIPAVPILTIHLLARSNQLVNIQSHYTAGLIAPLIMGAVYGLQSLKSPSPTTKIYLTSILLVSHIIISPSPLSWLFWSDSLWNFSWRAYWPTKRDMLIKRTIANCIPSDPKVIVSTQNTLHLKRLSARSNIMLFPNGCLSPVVIPDLSKCTIRNFVQFLTNRTLPIPQIKKNMADYVVLDLQRPWFIYDRGCTWSLQKSTLLKLALRISGYKDQAHKADIHFSPAMAATFDLSPGEALTWSRCAFTIPPPKDIVKTEEKSLANLFIRLTERLQNNYKLLFAKQGLIIFKRKYPVTNID